MLRKSVENSGEQVLKQAAKILAAGGCAVYPTETFYALGALVGSVSALSRINAIKGRPQSKPLPLIIGHVDQLAGVVVPDISRWEGYASAVLLMERFWPGPLSIIFPARPGLAPQVQDNQGRVCVRLTPHPQAQALCLLCKSPLAATSANLSGHQPVCSLGDLDPAVCLAVDMLVEGTPTPPGGLPSTLVLPQQGNRLTVLRQGALPLAALERAGFSLGR